MSDARATAASLPDPPPRAAGFVGPGTEAGVLLPPLAYAPAAAVQAVQHIAWRGVTVMEWAAAGPQVEAAATPAAHLALMVRAGRRLEGETRLGTTLRSSLRDVAGTVTVVPAGLAFSDRSRAATSLRMLSVAIDPAASFLGDAAPRPLPRLLEADPRLGTTMLKLRALLGGGARGEGLHAETLAMLLLFEMAAPPPRPERARGGLTSRQRRLVTDHIEAHLNEEVSLTELAGLAGVSPFHLCRAFKSAMGLPPHRWQIRRRVERAKERLAEPRATVTEIGHDLGFGSSSHFAYRFRQETGMTPTEFRRSLTLPGRVAAIG